MMLLDDDGDDDDTGLLLGKKNSSDKAAGADPFAAKPAVPANDANAAAANNEDQGDTGPLTLEKLGEYLEALPDETAVSMAELYQNEDGRAFFNTFFKNSFAVWPHGQPCPYRFWCDVLADVSSTSSRNDCTRRLAYGLLIILLRGTPQDAAKAIYLCINELAPAHEGKELGVADGTLIPAISKVCGMEEKKVRAEYARAGDLAEIAQNHKRQLQRFTVPKPLMLAGVFSKFTQIAETKGTGAQAKREAKITELLRDAQGCEVNFLIRALQGKMRIGVALRTLNAALGHAFALRTLVTLVAIENKKKDGFYQKVTFMGPGGPAAAAAGGSANNNNNNCPFDEDDFPLIAPWHSKKISAEDLMKLLKNFADSVSHAYHQFPVVDELIETICNTGRAALPSEWLKQFKIRAGVPVKPMLAHPTTSIAAMLDRFGGKKFTCEYKYDGERGQVHFVRGGIKKGANSIEHEFEMYSRNSESYTTKFPDIIRCLPDAFNGKKNGSNDQDGGAGGDGDDLKVDSFIMDGEVVAVEEGTGRLRPFQVLQSRGKKNVDADNVTCKVKYFAFDLLMLNGESLMKQSLRERREKLRKYFNVCDTLGFATGKDSDDVDEIQTFLDESVASGCEGLMVKTLDEAAAYQPSQRSHYWMKLKKDYMQGCGDTLDLVPIGAYNGVGKRTGKYGGFLMACYNEEEGRYETVCKCGTGFSDADLANYTEILETQTEPVVRGLGPSLVPDVWITPTQVWEIKAADLSKSPVHTSGIALRFPRHLKRREDKNPEDATTSDQVAKMYNAQALVMAEAAAAGPANLEDDEY